MQDHDSHRQQPMLFLVPIDGEAKPLEQLDEECRADLLAVAERHQAALSGSTSLWLPFLAVILDECVAPVAETAPSVRAV